MKILTFVDVHSNQSAKEKIKQKIINHDPDLLVCAGDISIFENNLKEELEFYAKFKKPVLMIPGNHESEEILYTLSSMYKNIIFLVINKKIMNKHKSIDSIHSIS